MPRINVEATNREILAPAANAKFIEEHYPGRSVNDGWGIDDVSGYYSSKVYGDPTMVVTTEMRPPFKTTAEEY